MDMIDLSSGQYAILQDKVVLEQLPPELLEIIRLGDRSRFLDALAAASLIPALTLRLFARFEAVFADTCARWISDSRHENLEVIEAFSRVLRFAPHLLIYLLEYLQPVTPPPPDGRPRLHDPELLYLSDSSRNNVSELSVVFLERLLLAVLRLLIFDRWNFIRIISIARIQSLLRHSNCSIRYLAVRILCRLLSASDAKQDNMMGEYVGKDKAVMGDFDGFSIDYGLLSLYEDKAANEVAEMRKVLGSYPHQSEPLNPIGMSPFVGKFGGVLLPRPCGKPARLSALVPTRTTLSSMESLARALIKDSPILVYGPPGSGKTCLINDFARELRKDSEMLTLHLNEQTDAKMLIGMYATGSTPGSFSWRPGVLTTAIREGRWVFIEDLDRAPNEVISVILPLVERGELLVPSRGETIRAAPGFRLVASIRTYINIEGNEIPPGLHMLGARFWSRVSIKMPQQDEFIQIINKNHPILSKYLPGIIAVYKQVRTLSQKNAFTSKSRGSFGRPISPRDLLKWCRRLDAILVNSGSKTGDEPVTEATKDEMFMEAADCFASSLQEEDARSLIISAIAEEMHIPMQRVEHYLNAYIPRYHESEEYIQVGRAQLQKRKTTDRITKSSKHKRPFADTTHAKRLLEQIGVALKMAEPVLLVGETGIGKTAVVQRLADSLGYKLHAVNLSQQSEVGDLLGGFKPVNIRSLAIPLKEEFDDLFARTGISTTRNQKYMDQLGKAVAKSQWSRASKLWREAPRMFERILLEISKSERAKPNYDGTQPTKKRRMESKLQELLDLKPRWERFSQNLDQFDVQLSNGSKGFAFTFVEGNIIKAARNGEWVLLDEINLGSPDTLESIADLLHSGSGSSPSILLSETGQIERVWAHPDFRIFGAMNPATDTGKRDLPTSLRSRFTEIYVESPDRNRDDLLSVIKAYLNVSSSNDERTAHDVASLYMETKRRSTDKSLVDGANQVPHFSLRTLTRVLGYVTEIAPSYGLRRALYEGYAMGFLTLLNRESERTLMPLINHYLFDAHGNPQSLLSQTPRHPGDGKKYVRFMNKIGNRQYWMLQGRETPQEQPQYIITPFVERNMLNLVRATSTRKFPVLIQGPTSAGKTSMVEYLAKFSGNKYVRINNHEHTDLQEYLGTYISGSNGQLRFQEGLLVQALREGHWIVLDELNLAPSDVLEALNRLLDDNRELLIPETQEIVRPHENFMLFATQNPPGLYGGRKTLSRAFRNRFLELHFDDIPEDELEFILEHRSQKVAPSDCRRIVAVYKELSRLRQTSRLFEQKDSFATLRDLFRWSLRDADNREQLAANGYMLLAERVRKPEEKLAVKEVIEKVMKVKLDYNTLYSAVSSPEIQLYNSTANSHGVVWTNAMRRLYILISQALRNNEPVLLVGETGCGKTTVCQMLAEAFGKELHIVNAHQNTETGDLIGAQRPVRNRAINAKQLEEDLQIALHGKIEHLTNDPLDIDLLLIAYDDLPSEERMAIPSELHQRIKTGRTRAKALFEWSDGSLVHAMKESQFFLLDEISLADDSVLERLNSVLEPERTLLLAEKGVEESFVQAADGFQFFATMNPGGDYGKRELSPALRNRFTEIWVPALSDHGDVLQIIEQKLTPIMSTFANAIVKFADWFGQKYRPSATQTISIRDVLAWVTFVNGCNVSEPHFAVLHGAAMVYIDTLGANPAALLAINPESIIEERTRCLQQLGIFLDHDITTIYLASITINNTVENLSFGHFSIKKTIDAVTQTGFAFEAPTTRMNAMRIVRALQVRKPILIEGNPGVGKTTIVMALANAVGIPLTRINLSEQTDLMDLFGSDVPVEGAEAGNFVWRDAPFLQAMQKGEWVLLDEMNLASQSVLEGLNACLDHRGTVYISELDQTFERHPSFCVFAAQNPHHQGGGRKGLPSSFVNRFTVVYADIFGNADLKLICRHIFPAISGEVMSNVINFVSILEQEVVYRRRFGSQGGPWEFNLRDGLRWLQLLSSREPLLADRNPAEFLNIIFRQRFRTDKDRQEVDKIFAQVFGQEFPFRHYFHRLSADSYQVGIAYLDRDTLTQKLPFPKADPTARLAELESIMICVKKNLPCILVGSSGCGKSTLIQHVAAASGAELVIFSLNSDIDTMDLVGGYEQVDTQRATSNFLSHLYAFLETCILNSIPMVVPPEATELLRICSNHDYTVEVLPSVLQQLVVLLEVTSLAKITDLISTCQTLIDSRNYIRKARFEWVDGVLVKALEEGKWLVLDNANLCSSSVLDRLNSLLEPNGVLSINEHCEANGEPKTIKPHANFRLFMTMDARFGELSRAMRNRAVEIYIDDPKNSASHQSLNGSNILDMDASLQRYRMVTKALQLSQFQGQEKLLLGVALDHLSSNDVYLLPRYMESIQHGLIKDLNFDAYQLLQRYKKIFFEGYEGFWLKAAIIYEPVMDTPYLQSFKGAQTLHPLQNSPLVPLLQLIKPCQSYWLGALQELQLNILDAHDALQSQSETLVSLRTSQMNRLQRSMVRGRVPIVEKDSTVNAAIFLLRTLEITQGYVKQNMESSNFKIQKKALEEIMNIWWETYRLISISAFEPAVFQAHLSICKEILTGISESLTNTALQFQVATFNKLPIKDIAQLIQLLLQSSFGQEFTLTTGLSMEILWRHFRPKPVSSIKNLQILNAMENLATRFDALKWRVSISITELSSVISSLVKAYHLILTSNVDGSILVNTLSSELARLEDTAEITDKTPFFSSQFEALRQSEILNRLQPANDDITILARTSSASLMQFKSASITSLPLQIVDYLWGQGEVLFPIEDSFSVTLLNKLCNIHEVDLESLSLLETELPILGLNISRMSALLCRNQLSDLNGKLSQLILKILEVHGAHISGNLRDGVNISEVSANFPPHLQVVLRDHLSPALAAICDSESQPSYQLKYSSLAWIHFALGCLDLYVPNRSFDPSIKQRLKHERHGRIKKNLQDHNGALRTFEKIFTGQDSNLRCQVLEEELLAHGEATTIDQHVLRPEVSELEILQGEFNNILTIMYRTEPDDLVEKCFASEKEDAPHQIALLQKNIKQVIRRLTLQPGLYRDITVPVVSILRCLQVGLYMASMTLANQTSTSEVITTLSITTPFLGGTPTPNEFIMPEYPVASLENIAMLASVEGLANFDAERRRMLFDMFHSIYAQWSKKLDIDRKGAESRAGLYRFRGSAEDEEEHDQEEFDELFPTYEEDLSRPVKLKPNDLSPQDTAIALADVHRKLFCGGDTATDSIMKQLRHASRHIGTIYQEGSKFAGSNMTGSLLPGALLLLNDQMQALNPSSLLPESYNFYTDANFSETRKLLILIHQIQKRFRELQNVDEIAHMQPLEDVMVSCHELLKFRHTEPLAKTIMKVEQIHGFIHEWQFGGWASRVNSVLSLYDNLTATIVNWRRLELSTWAKLFDLENQKCGDDAKSWWFIAYEVVIAAPVSMAQSESDLNNYAQKLLQELEAYFATAILGQFSQRLKLLKQLQQHLKLLLLELPLLSSIYKAVANFTEIYTRYEKSVNEQLQNGRKELEKAMRNVLLLASWKDTNIVALRDSARRSHHKLFKLVRKYRALLGQRMDQIIRQGLPDETDGSDNYASFIPSTTLLEVNETALALCESHIPNWTLRSKRLTKISVTVSLMESASQLPAALVDAQEYLDTFSSHIIDSSVELQKVTPSTLTDENKDMVKHLKTRKRKLYADILKELRKMGIKHNLGTVALSKQNSLSIILASTEVLELDSKRFPTNLNYYYHKVLDYLPRARAATRQHSDDLSSAEVFRSIGLLEGLLQFILKQRNALLPCIMDFEKLSTAIKTMESLWAPGKYEIHVSNLASTHTTVLQWLPNILRVGIELVRIHNKFGNSETLEVQHRLLCYIQELENLKDQWQSLPMLPEGIASTNHDRLKSDIHESVSKLRSELIDFNKNYPDLEFILQQILPWTNITSASIPLSSNSADISILDHELSQVCDSVLVTIEKLSKSMLGFPRSIEDLAWLVKNEECLLDNITSLHIDNMISRIGYPFEVLTGISLDDEISRKAASALFAVALPIFQQYLKIAHQAILRYSQLHRATCKLTFILAKIFTQIASQGFCTPSDKSNAQDSKTQNLEGGTGLGDGEGAEDISKDIQDDEDLSELAQEPNNGKQEDLEDEKDAVDMADDDMEGNLGDEKEKGDDENENSNGEEGEDIDEEAGNVDDLDPNSVDEKMWDGEGEKAEKEQEDNQSKGKASKDEQSATQDNDKQASEGEKGDDNDEGKEDEDEDEFGIEQGEKVNQEDIENHDLYSQDVEALELPDDIELDGNENNGSVASSDDVPDALSDASEEDDGEDEIMDDGDDAASGVEDTDAQENLDAKSELDNADLDNEDAEAEKTEDGVQKGEEDIKSDFEDQEGLLREQFDDATVDPNENIKSEAKGTGEDQDKNQPEDDNKSNSNAQRNQGEKGGDSSEQTEVAAEEGEKSGQAKNGVQDDQNEVEQTAIDSQPFKKLGDALERWHRQQNKIQDASTEDEKLEQQPINVDGDHTGFQHLQDEDAEADTQALGTATDDQAQAVDESMAIDEERKEISEIFLPDEPNPDMIENHDEMDIEPLEEQQTPEATDAYEGRAGAMIKQANSNHKELDDHPAQETVDVEGEIEEVDVQLSTTHIDDLVGIITSRSSSDARKLWTHYEGLTRDLSLSLTEQLRLILAPTLATKMRGDFRTGKRLNIKRIIPYIASQYKRDKIWMRRSVPSKRSYQIMLAVDDSKSMAESGSGSLAFETLVMVSKSLSMLEVGEICIVSFGEDFLVAHDFETPFSADAGPKVFQNFGFEQSRTDVTKLVRKSIELFRAARAKASNSPADLWQLQLIISDGVCDSSEHEPIRRLLREAIEERIMMVFVIVDDVKNKKIGESVMDLKEAKFVKDELTGSSNVKIERYLDTFPFQYYLVVSDVKELPGVLATLLRQWFAEVAESSG